MKPGKEHPAWLHRAMGGRCDRPARAEGGVAKQYAFGEGDSGKDKKTEVQALRDSSDAKARVGKALVPAGIVGALLGRKSIKAVPAALTAASTGIVALKDADDDRKRALALNAEADKDEGKARGGRAKKRSK